MPESQRAAYEGRILPRERDLQLNLSEPKWPEGGCLLGTKGEEPPPGAGPWQRHDGYLYRTISPKQKHLWEVMLRFPSAPIYGLHQSAARFPRIEGRSNFHTFRVIGVLPETSDDEALPQHRIRDVYLLHNGLNETGEADLHYQLASRLLTHSKRPAVCILRPFPGHLTRYPYNDSYAEQPLDTYLLDSGDLFRQFIRFMVETRWLLSMLVPRSSYKVITGGTLVECDQLGDSTELAERIVGEWNDMDRASIRMDKSTPKHARRPQTEPLDITVEAIETTIDVLRKDVLRWREASSTPIPEPAEDEPPAVHVVGYSLGGFVAQSAFFAWPFAISGCISLFGGGELRKLAPTAFAEPEEWQSVLHALRYELDRAMAGPLKPSGEDGKVRGLPQETFEYLLRVFYEVFLQYYQGSYRTRLAEFIQRMMFVAGGKDPIVRPGNVLEAAPPEGANILTIAGMTHFPTKPKERVQREQREFWLEQLGRIVPAFAEQADERRLEVLQRGWLNDARDELHEDAVVAYSQYGKDLDGVAAPTGETSGASLSDRWFGKEIQHICDFIGGGSKGWVLVSRNEVPPVFQTADVLKQYAAGLHHSEDLAADEFWLASQRGAALEAGRKRVTLMITQVALDTGFEKTPWMFPPRSETPGVPRLSKKQRQAAEDHFNKIWRRPRPKAVRVLYPGEFEADELGEIGGAVAELQRSRFEEHTPIDVHFLPDVWIGIHEEVLGELERRAGIRRRRRGSRSSAEAAIVAWAARLAAGEKNDMDLLIEHLADRTISIIKFSRAGLNPRHRGQRETNPKKAAGVLVHWALAYRAARVRRRVKKRPFV